MCSICVRSSILRSAKLPFILLDFLSPSTSFWTSSYVYSLFLQALSSATLASMVERVGERILASCRASEGHEGRAGAVLRIALTWLGARGSRRSLP